jgi:hypothetical protein
MSESSEPSCGLGCLIAFTAASGLVQFVLLPRFGITAPWWAYLIEAVVFAVLGLLLWVLGLLDRSGRE